MSKLLESLYLKAQVLLNRRAITETMAKGTVTAVQIKYLDTDPKQETLFQLYLDLIKNGNEQALTKFRNGLSSSQKADLLRRGTNILEKNIGS